MSCYKTVKMACCLCTVQNFPPSLTFSKMVSNFVYPNLVSQRLAFRGLACSQVWACILQSPQNSFSRPICSVAAHVLCYSGFIFFWWLRTAVCNIQNVIHTVSFVFLKSVKLFFLETLILINSFLPIQTQKKPPNLFSFIITCRLQLWE